MPRRRHDPEPYGAYIEFDDRESMGFLPRLVVFAAGALLGLAGAAFLLAHPYVLGLILQSFEDWTATLSADKRELLPVVGALFAVALLVIARRIVFGSAAFWGLLFGGFLWVPFGHHLLAGLPAIETELPSLRNGLDAFVESRESLAGIRTWAETTFPLDASEEDAPG